MQSIPLSKLALSEKYNVRKTNNDKDLGELVANIKTLGLLENLVVVPANNDNYEVIAGGRRFRALTILQDEGHFTDDYEAPCEVVGEEHAEEISLAENTIRAEMHPADQFEAFAKLANDGMCIADIAARFGVSDNIVAKRLKLGRVSPKLMDAYRNEELNLEALMSFTLTDDHKKQEELFNRIKGTWCAKNSNSIKNSLTETSVKGDNKLAKFVGIEAYEEAGGTIRRDLFSRNDDVYFEDLQLLEELAKAKLDKKAEEFHKEHKWSWMETCLEFGYEERDKYKNIYHHQIAPIPDEIIERQEELQKKRSEVDFSNEGAAEEARILSEELDAIQKKIESLYMGFDDEEYAIGGCIITIDYHGKFDINEGLVRAEDAKALEKSSDEDATETIKKPSLPYSNPLMERLKNYRLHSVKMAVAKDYDTAFDLALYMMCVKSFPSYYCGSSCLKIQCEKYYYPVDLSSNDETCIAFGEKEEKFYQKLPLAWLSIEDQVEQFNAFCKLKEPQKQRLFAACVSKSLQPQLSIEQYKSSIFEAVSKRLNVDVTKDWRPTADNFLNRVTKVQLLEIGKELIGEDWVKEHQKKTKGDVVTLLHTAFNKPSKKEFTEEQLAALATWLPEGMDYKTEEVESE